MSEPIKFYAWPTPNGKKVAIMLEECALPYEVVPVNITKGDQHEDWFRALNPNGKMPVITDPDGPDGKPITIFESGAILGYLGQKTGKFFPRDIRARVEVAQWLMWQMAGFGPMLGQAHHFRQYAPEKVEYGIERYTKEANRLYKVLDKRLGEVPFLAGRDYTIADIATYPWALDPESEGVDIGELPNVQRWLEVIGDRPAVHRGLDFMSDYEEDVTRDMDEDKQAALFSGR